MDFLSGLIAAAIPYGFTPDEVKIIHENYCQNLYFQPDGLDKMLQYECNIDAIEREISRVKSGRY